VIGICRFIGKNPDVTEINLEVSQLRNFESCRSKNAENKKTTKGIAFKKVGSAMFCRALVTNTNLQSLNLAVLISLIVQICHLIAHFASEVQFYQ